MHSEEAEDARRKVSMYNFACSMYFFSFPAIHYRKSVVKSRKHKLVRYQCKHGKVRAVITIVWTLYLLAVDYTKDSSLYRFRSIVSHNIWMLKSAQKWYFLWNEIIMSKKKVQFKKSWWTCGLFHIECEHVENNIPGTAALHFLLI
jgi:hypothetical protein